MIFVQAIKNVTTPSSNLHLIAPLCAQPSLFLRDDTHLALHKIVDRVSRKRGTYTDMEGLFYSKRDF